MSDSAPYIFIVSMDVDADKEALFNEVYDTEHIPLLMQVPGVRLVKRYRKMPLTVVLGGELRSPEFPDEPRYSAVYEIDGPAVLTSDAWAKAVDTGRWASEVRPFTHNRRHILRQRL
jgi:hypothetical protein